MTAARIAAAAEAAVTTARSSAGSTGLRPDTRLGDLFGIGQRNGAKLAKLGLETVADLLLYIPRRYEDTRELSSLESAVSGHHLTARVRVAAISIRKSPYRRMTLVEAVLEDATGSIRAVWFNQAYIAQQLSRGSELLVSGKVQYDRHGLSLSNPVFELVSHTQLHVGRLVPVYPETAGITSRFLRRHIEQLLPLARDLPDPLPAQIVASEGLVPIADAVAAAHFPENTGQIDLVRERFTFQKLFLLQLAAQRAQRRRQALRSISIPYDASAAREFVGSLPFSLTQGQRVAAHQILSDMANERAMNRLLQGDVGSGKTVVAAMAAFVACRAGFQTAIMAPTEVLARQHHQSLTALLSPLGLYPRLLVGSSKARARREILGGFAAGHEALVVGTHTLIEEGVELPHLGLVVVDEQHRFGVAQRQKLRQKRDVAPNFLAMTATPIPRSLALALYGDVNVTELREKPPGRQPVETRLVPGTGREQAYEFVRSQLMAGSQAFVICPLVEGSERLAVASAVEEFERLRNLVFPEFEVELLHGRMPAAEKQERMARFASGAAQLLVATSVVEVGVDVPNATVMLVEGADRFGLAQLHQFRGRVGRGDRASFCLLIASSDEEASAARLKALTEHESGFELAEIDLELRGPGDIIGLRQHGAVELETADLLNAQLMERARGAAALWLDQDPQLSSHPPLSAAMVPYREILDLD